MFVFGLLFPVLLPHRKTPQLHLRNPETVARRKRFWSWQWRTTGFRFASSSHSFSLSSHRFPLASPQQRRPKPTIRSSCSPWITPTSPTPSPTMISSWSSSTHLGILYCALFIPHLRLACYYTSHFLLLFFFQCKSFNIDISGSQLAFYKFLPQNQFHFHNDKKINYHHIRYFVLLL